MYDKINVFDVAVFNEIKKMCIYINILLNIIDIVFNTIDILVFSITCKLILIFYISKVNLITMS